MRVPAAAMVLAMLTLSALGDEKPKPLVAPIEGDLTPKVVTTVPYRSQLSIGGDSVVVITVKGVVQNHDGVPLDELPPAQQIEIMCTALSRLSTAYVGVEITRCGKP